MLTKGQKSPALARADASGEFLSRSSVTESLIDGHIWAFIMP